MVPPARRERQPPLARREGLDGGGEAMRGCLRGHIPMKPVAPVSRILGCDDAMMEMGGLTGCLTLE